MFWLNVSTLKTLKKIYKYSFKKLSKLAVTIVELDFNLDNEYVEQGVLFTKISAAKQKHLFFK